LLWIVMTFSIVIVVVRLLAASKNRNKKVT